MPERISSLQACLSGWQSDALVIDHPVDLFYLTDLRLSAGRLLLTPETAELFVDGRYYGIAKAKCPFTVNMLEDAALQQFFVRTGVQKIAFDSATTSYERYMKFKNFLHKEKRILIPVPAPLKNLRAVKSHQEWEKMRESAALTKEGFRHLRASLIPGVKEKELAWIFEKFCRERGAEKMAFDPIIAFGENTSFPHHRPTDRTWKAGEPVLFDAGCILKDYASDCTRTLWSAKVPKEFIRLHEIVVAAQQAALAICRPGTSFGALDAAARQVMRDEGVEELFVHSLGHGIGLETHEYPRISLKADEKDHVLQEGMVITIEPGLYAAGICGSRYEDTVIVRKEGPENLYQDLHLNKL